MLLERAQAGQVQTFEIPAVRVDGSTFRLGVTAEAVRDADHWARVRASELVRTPC